MRNSLSGLLLGAAAALGSLALGGAWLQLTSFSTGRSYNTSHQVLRDAAIRNEIGQVVAQAAAPTLGQNPALVQQVVAAGAATGEGSDLLAGVIAQAHAHLIGASTKPVFITAEQMVPLVGNQLAATVAPAAIAVPTIGAMSTTRQVLNWLVPISGAAATLLILAGLATRPNRAEQLRALSVLLLGTALMLVIFGFIVPALILPLFSDNAWASILPNMARTTLGRLMLAAALIGLGGAACLASAAAARRRDRWSQPIRTRYTEQRRWS
ncbi:MAG: hypothetical protein WCK14_01775 [Actinomycetota bacterium]